MGIVFLAIFIAMMITNVGQPGIPGAVDPTTLTGGRDCSYHVDSSNSVHTNSAFTDIPDLIQAPQGAPNWIPRSNRLALYNTEYGNKDWTLVKENAWIPRFKVWSGGGESMAGREMDLYGIVTEKGVQRWSYIALGHCYDFNNPTTCADPITKSLIYVVEKKGFPINVNDPEWQYIVNHPEIEAPDNPDVEYWVFNVYLSQDLLTTNLGGVPCWLEQCRGGDVREIVITPTIMPADWNNTCTALAAQIGRAVPTVAPLVSANIAAPLSATDAYPPSFIKKEWISLAVPTPQEQDMWSWPFYHVQSYSWLGGKVNSFPVPTPPQASPVFVGQFSGKLGTKDEIFNVYADRMYTTFSDGRLYLEPTLNLTGFKYVYVPSAYTAPADDVSGNESLKLGTMTASSGFVYEWWYPSCKPVIYLYPEKETIFDIRIKPFGILTKSIPEYPFFTGWQDVLAKPDGQLSYQNQNYEYLYYEGKSFYLRVPGEGFNIKGSELADFFEAILPKLGLKGKEIADFKSYWLSRLTAKDSYYFVSIIPREEIDRVEGMTINPVPENLIRVRLFFKKLDKPQLFTLPIINITPTREGTTVVEWGGFYKD